MEEANACRSDTTKAIRSRLVPMSPSWTRGSAPVPLNGGTTPELIRFLLLRVLAQGVWQEDLGRSSAASRMASRRHATRRGKQLLPDAESAALSGRDFLVAWTSSSGLQTGHNVDTSETDCLEKQLFLSLSEKSFSGERKHAKIMPFVRVDFT